MENGNKIDKYRKQYLDDIDRYWNIERLNLKYHEILGKVDWIYTTGCFTEEEIQEGINYDKFVDVNVDDIKRQGKYEYYLKLAYRSGYKPYKKVSEDGKEVWKELTDLERDQLVILEVITEQIYKAGYNPKQIEEIHGVHPKFYVKDCVADNMCGNFPTPFVNIFDQSVREACRVLNSKGYKTYWSSANMDDISSRTGDIVKDKNVAYILIDPSNLTNELKERLFLNGNNELWGVALSYAEKENPKDKNGKYYGIWAEITSPDMSCYELSEKLVEEAIALPSLVNKHEIVRQQIEDEKNKDPHRRI